MLPVEKISIPLLKLESVKWEEQDEAIIETRILIIRVAVMRIPLQVSSFSSFEFSFGNRYVNLVILKTYFSLFRTSCLASPLLELGTCNGSPDSHVMKLSNYVEYNLDVEALIQAIEKQGKLGDGVMLNCVLLTVQSANHRTYMASKAFAISISHPILESFTLLKKIGVL
ncbi:hypothetical protein F0562_016711 [Nyssa sinensis]|uniref:Uncharacterized protein n=1 Tax=Nyssa sinensis TaxID=561372 RepID=A0A5J4ZG24_9ASTE|nr:hypothetical protein F0562_016711 [Nyssa sinensis]